MRRGDGWRGARARVRFVARGGARLAGRARLQLWRVRWNLTGTVLVTTGDDAAVRMWRRAGASALAAAHGGPVAEWQCVKRLTAESAGAVGMDMDVPLSPAAEAWSAARGGEGAD